MLFRESSDRKLPLSLGSKSRHDFDTWLCFLAETFCIFTFQYLSFYSSLEVSFQSRVLSECKGTSGTEPHDDCSALMQKIILIPFHFAYQLSIFQELRERERRETEKERKRVREGGEVGRGEGREKGEKGRGRGREGEKKKGELNSRREKQKQFSVEQIFREYSSFQTFLTLQ